MKIKYILLVVIIDQLTKFIIRQSLQLHQTNPVTSFFSFTYIQNPGIAFGLFNDAKYSNIFFIFVSVGILYSLTLFYHKVVQRKQNNKFASAGVLLIYGGAIGNLVDRVVFGKVIDFIDLHFWPVFNIADASITVGGIVLFLSFCGILKYRKL